MEIGAIIDLDDARDDWRFNDLRRRDVPVDLFSAGWQEQRRAAMREREAASAVARRAGGASEPGRDAAAGG